MTAPYFGSGEQHQSGSFQYGAGGAHLGPSSFIFQIVLSVAGDVSKVDHFAAELTEGFDELGEVVDALQAGQRVRYLSNESKMNGPIKIQLKSNNISSSEMTVVPLRGAVVLGANGAETVVTSVNCRLGPVGLCVGWRVCPSISESRQRIDHLSATPLHGPTDANPYSRQLT